MTDEYQTELSSELEKHFPDDQEVISDVVERVHKAPQYEYTDHLGLHDSDNVVSGIENWAQGKGLLAG